MKKITIIFNIGMNNLSRIYVTGKRVLVGGYYYKLGGLIYASNGGNGSMMIGDWQICRTPA